MVPEIITGSRAPRASNSSSIANSAALALSVSKMVSTISTSAPPSSSPPAASRYAVASSSKLIARNPGRFTSGLSEAVRLVGPRTPIA